MYKVDISLAAELEIEEIVDWYEGQKNRFGF